MIRTRIDTDYRVQLPPEWARSLGVNNVVALEKTADGILVRPCEPATWDDFYATKLPVGAGGRDMPPVEVSDEDHII